MNVKQIIELLPVDVLDELAVETKVNKYAKKLDGKTVFRLLIYCILSYKDNSLRRMESHFESIAFSYLNQNSDTIKYNSISERLSTMKVSYFESLYNRCIVLYGSLLPVAKMKLIKYDSTIVSLSSKLLKVGYNISGSASKLNQIKYSIGFDELPEIAYFYTEQRHTSENVALKKVVTEHNNNHNNYIKVFDRGITSRETYDELIDNKTPFVSRINTKCKHKIIRNNLVKNKEEDELHIISDDMVFLYKDGGKKSKHPIRLIQALNTKNKTEIAFITSIKEQSAQKIAELYRQRWKIETFFKFLKQELNFSHFVNRSENGIAIMLYTTLIAAILLLVYKKLNKLSGYKIMKQKFVQELEWIITEDIIKMCGGNPNLLYKTLGKDPPL